jgi:hypothetical protein
MIQIMQIAIQKSINTPKMTRKNNFLMLKQGKAARLHIKMQSKWNIMLNYKLFAKMFGK